MKGWVDLVGWPAADGLPTWVVTRQLQVGRRTGKVRRPKTDVLPLSQRHHKMMQIWSLTVKYAVQLHSKLQYTRTKMVFKCQFSSVLCKLVLQFIINYNKIRYDSKSNINVHLKAGSSQLSLLHGTQNKTWKEKETKNKHRICTEESENGLESISSLLSSSNNLDLSLITIHVSDCYYFQTPSKYCS